MQKKIIITLLGLFLPLIIFCQSADPPPATFHSPYNTAYVHLYYLQQETFQPSIAAQALWNERGAFDQKAMERKAIRLKQILDGKGLYVRLEALPKDSNYLDSLSRQPFFTLFPEELPEVSLEKVNGKWLYSAATVEAIPALHKEVYPFGTDLLLTWLPKLGGNKFLGLAVWQYVGIAAILLIVFVLYFILHRIIGPLIIRLSRSRLQLTEPVQKILGKITRLLSVFIIFRLLKVLLRPLQLPIEFFGYLVTAIDFVSIILLVIIGLRIIDVLIQYASRYSEQTTSKLDEQLMPIVHRLLQAVIIIFGIIQALRLIEVDVTALIAGISIGGLALALAAQDTAKNLIGSATIFVDQPFQIGDWIEGSGFAGTVVEVGFRTTRIRRPDSSIISVPNGSIVNMNIQNLGVREFRMLDTNISITYNTPPDLIEVYIEGLKEILAAHPLTDPEKSYVLFSNMADSSLNIFFRAPIFTNDFGVELKTKEELLFAVVRLAEHLGVQFAFPSTSVYVESMAAPKATSLAPSSSTKKKEDVASFIEKYKEWLQA